MPASLVCVGKMKEKFYKDGADEYIKRLSKYVKFEVHEVPDLKEPQNTSDKIKLQIMEKEGEMILSKIKPTDFVVALVINAKQRSSEELSELVHSCEVKGKKLTFVIGGSLGLSQSVLDRADDTLSMSKMTFPHQLARVVLLEQFYRAYKILNNENYHK